MKSIVKKLILLLISGIFLYFIFHNLDIKELVKVLKDFNLIFVIFVCISAMCSFSCRGLCFKLLMSKTKNLPIKELVPLCITGAALNVLLPARAGDLFRAIFVGHKYDISKLKVLGTVILERMFDTFVIFVFLLVAINFYHKNALAQNLCSFAGIAMASFAIFAFIAYRYNKTDLVLNFFKKITLNKILPEQIQKFIDFLNNSFNSFCAGFEIMAAPKRMIGVIFTSFGIWFFEAMNFYIVLTGFGYHVHWSVTLFVIGFIALACMIPSASIFIGPYQMAVIAAFAIYGIEKEAALAITLVQQSIILILTSLIAVIFLLKNNISFSELKNKLSKNEE